MARRRVTALAGTVLACTLTAPSPLASAGTADRSAATVSSAERRALPLAASRCDPAAPAQPEIVSVVASPVKRPVGVHDVHQINFDVTLRDDCNLANHLEMYSYKLDRDHSLFEDYGHWDPLSPDAEGFYHARVALDIHPTGLTTDWAGTYTSHFHLVDQDELRLHSATGPNWRLQRWSRMSNNATEPARKGSTIIITGLMTRANWDDHAYHAAPRQWVKLQRRTFTGSYVDVGYAFTDGNGQARRKVTATVSSCFRYVFEGSTTTMAVKGVGDCVTAY